MPDQTIQIRLILQDELTKHLGPIEAALKRIGDTRIDKAHGGMERFGGAVRLVHRELSTLSRLTLGGLVGGGVIAGLAALTRSLQDLSAQQIQLRYSSQALGVSTTHLENWKRALEGLGESPEAAASSIKRSIEILDEFMQRKDKSQLGSFLKESKGGASIARELTAIIAKEGNEAGQLFLINVAKHIIDRKGRADFLRQVSLPYSALGIEKMLEALPKGIKVSDEQVDKMAITSMQLARHQDNITKILAGAMLPAITAITKSLSEYLQSEAGQKFSKQLGEIADDISKAISTWIAEGGLQSALTALEIGFTAADKVIKAIGLSWPLAIAGLVGIKFAAWLGDVAGGLEKIKANAGLLGKIGAIAALYTLWTNKDAISQANREQMEETLKRDPRYAEEMKEKGYIGIILDIFKQLFQGNVTGGGEAPQKQSGTGKPQTEDEQRAAAATDANERKALNDKLADLAVGTGHLADYIGQTAIGGPEGTPGISGYGAGVSETLIRGSSRGGSRGGSRADRSARRGDDYMRQLWGGFPGGINLPPSMDPRGIQRAVERIAPGSDEEWEARKQRALNLAGPGVDLERTAGKTPEGYGGGGTLPYPGYIQKQVEEGTSGRTPDYDAPGDFYSSGKSWQRKYGRPGDAFNQWTGAPSGQPINFSGSSDTIINSLARENGGGGSFNGNATIDIDVGGLGQSGRDPSSLFVPQSLDGAVQMQNAPQSQHNPLSFQ